jgi:hypothetical protein
VLLIGPFEALGTLLQFAVALPAADYLPHTLADHLKVLNFAARTQRAKLRLLLQVVSAKDEYVYEVVSQ